MNKPRFTLDDLQVQTFETTMAARLRPSATVRAQTELPIEETGWNDPACNPTYTQGSSCQNGGESCDGCGTGATAIGCGGYTSQCAFSDVESPCGTGRCGSTSLCSVDTCAGPTCGGATCPAGSCVTGSCTTVCP